jgi:membrane-associated HD superfamily phosphohydrolase
MAFDLLRPGLPYAAAEFETRYGKLFCLVLLTAGCALASFALACATPFAAYAVVAAAMLPLWSALLVVGAAWIVNQAIGFGALHYPHDANTVFWGLAIGAAALAATATAALLLRALSRRSQLAALGAVLVVGYAAYELVLFAFAQVLGGSGAFTPAIIARLGLLNAAWLVGLLAVCQAAIMLDRTWRRRLAA